MTSTVPMPAPAIARLSSKILVFAPTGNDGRVTAKFLSDTGHGVRLCHTMTEVCREADEECDLILLAEETLNLGSVQLLREALGHQPPWSDVPVIVITSGAEASSDRLHILTSLGTSANVGLLERPFRRGTMISTVDVALRARQRQHQIRDLLAERKQAEAKLEETVKERTSQLTETNDQLETLVYSIAHDLRAPLRSMQAFSQILLEDYAPKLDEAATSYARRIVKSSETMDALVLDLLAYGKTARSELELEPIELEAAWQGALDLFESEISQLDATVTTLRPLPRVVANLTTLTQILANLLGNALKFVPPGVAPAVTFSAEVREDRVRMTVQDNGVGVAPQYHEKIFRVFERLHKDRIEGTGIGLAIVRKGTERMGGSVGVESCPPQAGSRFWVELKKAPAIS